VLDYVVVLVHLNIISKNVEPQPFYKNMLSKFFTNLHSKLVGGDGLVEMV
jgi:hypothetical protein